MLRLLFMLLMLLSTSAFADPAKPRMSLWEFLVAWQGPPRQEQQEQHEQKQQREQPQQRERERHKKPPCGRCCYAGGEAVNYPPFDLEP